MRCDRGAIKIRGARPVKNRAVSAIDIDIARRATPLINDANAILWARGPVRRGGGGAKDRGGPGAARSARTPTPRSAKTTLVSVRVAIRRCSLPSGQSSRPESPRQPT